MGTTGIVRTWNQQLGWGVIDSEATPGGASATVTTIRVEAVADLTGFPMMGLRPGTQVEFEWSVADPPVNGCDYEAQLVWPAGATPPEQSSGAYSGSLWNSVGDPGPDGLTIMRQVTEPDEAPQPEAATLPTAVGTVRSWNDSEGWGVLDSGATPGGAWAHFSEVAGTGFRSLTAGQAVEFDYEDRGQDGYGFRANNIRALE